MFWMRDVVQSAHQRLACTPLHSSARDDVVGEISFDRLVAGRDDDLLQRAVAEGGPAESSLPSTARKASVSPSWPGGRREGMELLDNGGRLAASSAKRLAIWMIGEVDDGREAALPDAAGPVELEIHLEREPERQRLPSGTSKITAGFQI